MTELFAPDSWLNASISMISDFMWSHFLIAMLIGCGLYFTWRLRFAQFRMIGEMVRLLSESVIPRQGEKHISSFQAFAVSVATRVGTGNLAGVASAIAIGGSGAIFWMWVTSLVGAASAFVESTLAQLYKRRSKDSFVGGPAYYMIHGLHCRWMASLFAVLICLTFGLSYNSIQANTICGAWQEAFGLPPVVTGIALAAMGIAIVFGGIQRIAKVSSVLVPVMAIGFFVLSIVVIIMNISIFSTCCSSNHRKRLRLRSSHRRQCGSGDDGRHQARPVLQRGRRGLSTQRGSNSHHHTPSQTGTDSGARRIYRYAATMQLHGIHHPGERRVSGQ